MSNLVQHNPASLAERVRALDVEAALEVAVARGTTRACPPRLASALRYALFPGGARLRPALLVATAHAAGDPSPRALAVCAAAIELLHGASLVHDDLACFDDAATRRGRPALPRVFGEAMAVLVGDALIVLAFEQIAEIAIQLGGARAAAVLRAFAAAAGARGGLVAGQAWELEPTAPVDDYHRAKTGSLFALATRVGAMIAGDAPERWAAVGAHLGAAYQAADDLADATSDPATLGKPAGRDAALGRPSLVRAVGTEGARARVREAMDAAMGAVPPGRRQEELRAWLASAIAGAGVLRAAG